MANIFLGSHILLLFRQNMRISENIGHIELMLIVKMQNICNLIVLNSVHISDTFNYYRANIYGMWNAGKLGGIYKTFKFSLT